MTGSDLLGAPRVARRSPINSRPDTADRGPVAPPRGGTMQSRMRNPAVVIPEARRALFALAGVLEQEGFPRRTINLVHLRASQINGCSFCVDMHARDAKKEGDTDRRLF